MKAALGQEPLYISDWSENMFACLTVHRFCEHPKHVFKQQQPDSSRISDSENIEEEIPCILETSSFAGD